MQLITFFANCPRYLEGLLLEELRDLGATRVKETVTGVYFEGTLETAYRVCLWSRLANRVLMPLITIDATDLGSIHRGIDSIDWSSHFTVFQTFRVDFSGQSSLIRQSQFGAQLVKDVIVDQFRDRTGKRPSIETKEPHIRIHAHVYGDKLELSLDLSGESLHKRGYHLSGGDAPLKENLAAAILIRAGFAKRCESIPYVVDPLCGSGTLLIEAAFIATDRAPGLLRERFGFTDWKGHHPDLWHTLIQEAKERHVVGLTRKIPDFRGYDGSPRAISQARENIERAGLAKQIDVIVRELADLTPPTHHGNHPGFMVTNPPYGRRLGDEDSLRPLYQHLGERLRNDFQQWELALITENMELSKSLGIRAHKHHPFMNGDIACKLLLFKVENQWIMREYLHESTHAAPPVIPTTLPPDTDMFANRLRKNLTARKRWAEKNNVHCYRLYDADMPEYAAAIDVYHDYAHVQEYAPPKSIDPAKASERLKIICQSIPVVLGIPSHHVIVKQRRQQKDFSQYQRLKHTDKSLTVIEGDARLLVNLWDYLDTGLFLDHRPMRLHLAKCAHGKSFLNLFCYTASATVHAALGGAKRSLSVDMSASYTAWAKRNLALNGLSPSLHRVLQADCMAFLEENTEKFDLIFLDPPTFSRSKRMEHDFDIQRDHVRLIKRTLSHLAPGGTLFFSTNFRKFVFDDVVFAHLHVRDITRTTIDSDFERDMKVHQCFEITQVGA